MNAALPSDPPPAHDDASDPRLSGAPNFRSVAALPVTGGRRLRRRRIYRSDALHRLDEADLGTLAGLRIGTVLDLRREDERTSMPSRWPAGATRDTLTFDAAPDLQAVRAGGWRVQLGASEFDAAGAHRWMLETYSRMPAALGGAVREAARRLAAGGAGTVGAGVGTVGAGADAVRDPGAGGANGANGANPASRANGAGTTTPASVLVHCTAGKDRTGFVVALLLAALRVPRDDILDDYLESGRRQPPEALAQRLLAMSPMRPSANELAAIETIASVRPEFLVAALDTAERGHGSLERYLDACGVDAALREALADALLD